MARSKMAFRISFLTIFFTFFFCEFFIYFFVIGLKCSWPHNKLESHSHEPQKSLRAMILADTHLLGPIQGHWFDKLRREWQMKRAFQTSIQLFRPDVVIFLGDLFDEGHLVKSTFFVSYVKRFQNLFSVPPTTEIFIVAGNHDTGFHKSMHQLNTEAIKRFNKAMNTSDVDFRNIKGNNFILINSMAMRNDGCSFCSRADKRLIRISDKLQCDKNGEKCNGRSPSKYNRPIILQHFPLFRHSDDECSGEDAAEGNEKTRLFSPTHDCLSQKASEKVLSLQPRIIFSGHTHHGCSKFHDLGFDEKVLEISVPSFSWRNRNNPSFFLVEFNGDSQVYNKCFLPKESTVIAIYFLSFLAIILYNLLFFRIIPLPSTLLSRRVKKV